MHQEELKAVPWPPLQPSQCVHRVTCVPCTSLLPCCQRKGTSLCLLDSAPCTLMHAAEWEESVSLCIQALSRN